MGARIKWKALEEGSRIEDIDDDVHPRARVKCSGAAATPIHAILNDDPHAGVGNSESNLSIQSFIAFNRSIKQTTGRGIFRPRFGALKLPTWARFLL